MFFDDKYKDIDHKEKDKEKSKKYQKQNPVLISIGDFADTAIAIRNSNAAEDNDASAIAQDYSQASDNPMKSAVAQGHSNASRDPVNSDFDQTVKHKKRKKDAEYKKDDGKHKGSSKVWTPKH
ncbi:hypothetical protein [Bacillus vallismortis]|uniref:hypothetical protein n=1 Tax=Bacillus vallismortis TaxID=72361 RepID=UPI002090B9B8|nr:hypothetical protein [Bacillus vallismortis]MCO4850742.1 hypothetical protein [Bacillus vallismortis]